VNDYSEHSLQHGSNASAIAYVEMEHIVSAEVEEEPALIMEVSPNGFSK
jgi:hypothetical protein